MMRMQRCIIGCLMAADHVFTMTRSPTGEMREMRGEGKTREAAETTRGRKTQRERTEVVNSERGWW